MNQTNAAYDYLLISEYPWGLEATCNDFLRAETSFSWGFLREHFLRDNEVERVHREVKSIWVFPISWTNETYRSNVFYLTLASPTFSFLLATALSSISRGLLLKEHRIKHITNIVTNATVAIIEGIFSLSSSPLSLFIIRTTRHQLYYNEYLQLQ